MKKMNRKKAKDRVLLLLLFKMICPLLLGLCTSAQAHVSSQVVKINIDLQDVTLNDFFTELSKQSNYDFLYNHNLIAKRKRINLVAKDKELSLLLDEVLPSLGLEYVLKDNVVIVRERDQDQEIVAIKGRVVDESSNPLPGVTVLISKSKIGTVTDRAGNYLLPLPSKEEFTLVFSFIGMKSQSIKYTGQDSINVVMKEDFSLLEEVIVSTGYERIDLRTTTSAIQSIRAEDVVIPGLTSIDQMLEGHIPGMIFMQNSGQVGASPRLRIRGTSTVLGSREPLWVIDGIVQENPIDIDPEQINDLDFVNLLGNAITGLNPDDIAQIDILKDASATALYGARAANGVIVVTTKQGKQGPPSLSYSFSGTFSRRPHYSDASVNMMNSKERIDYSRELVEKRIVYPTIKEWIGYEKPLKEYWLGQISFEEMQEEVGYYESINTDWFDVLMRNSLSHNHTVSLSGGSSALRYYVSAGFADTRGNIRGEVNPKP